MDDIRIGWSRKTSMSSSRSDATFTIPRLMSSLEFKGEITQLCWMKNCVTLRKADLVPVCRYVHAIRHQCCPNWAIWKFGLWLPACSYAVKDGRQIHDRIRCSNKVTLSVFAITSSMPLIPPPGVPLSFNYLVIPYQMAASFKTKVSKLKLKIRLHRH